MTLSVCWLALELVFSSETLLEPWLGLRMGQQSEMLTVMLTAMPMAMLKAMQ